MESSISCFENKQFKGNVADCVEPCNAIKEDDNILCLIL